MSRNDITGDEIKTKVTTSAYRDNYDLIFGGGKALYKRESGCKNDRHSYWF